MSTKLSLPPKKPIGDPEEYSEDQIIAEYVKISRQGSIKSFLYFVVNYVKIYSNDEQGWIPFVLWDTDTGEYDNQLTLSKKVIESQYLAILKTRQAGITWLILAYILWMIVFFPVQNVLLLSKGDEESQQLMKRLKDMYQRLPYWMKAKDIVTDNLHELRLSNGSFVKSVSTRGGDSMTFTIAVVDEADLVWRSNTSLSQVLLNISPTVGLKGKLILLSKSEKSRPNSTFKNIYRAAQAGENKYNYSFIPWWVNPGRDEEWYEKEKALSLDIDNTLDALWESYPASPEEALAPKSASKRFPFAWLTKCYHKSPYLVSITRHKNDIKTEDGEYDGPVVEGLTIYELPDIKEQYVIGADPAEGLATSDDSALVVMRRSDLQEVATLYGKITPHTFALHINEIGKFYNQAEVLYELNNHGQLLGQLLRDGSDLRLLYGWQPNKGRKKQGWHNANRSIKAMLYNTVANKIKSEECIINNPKTYAQLSSIDQYTLSAPKGENDDLADAFCLAVAAIELCTSDFSWGTIRL